MLGTFRVLVPSQFFDMIFGPGLDRSIAYIAEKGVDAEQVSIEDVG